MTPRSPRYLNASGPTNRRNAKPAPRAHVAAGADNYASRSASRAQLGPGLRRQLQPARSPRTSTLQPALAALALIGGIALATLHGNPLWFGVGLLVAGWIALRRHIAIATTLAHEPVLGLGPTEIDTFDSLLADIAGELTSPHRATLREIKTLIADIAAIRSTQDPPALEARFYAAACIRRYVPDSLTAFLVVPAAQREEPLLDASHTATDLLTQQLHTICAALRAHQRHAAHQAAAALVRQHHFLTRRAPATAVSFSDPRPHDKAQESS